MKHGIEEKTVNINYTPTVQIDLAEKTTKIKGNNKEDKQYIAKEYQVNNEKSTLVLALDVALLAVAVILMKFALEAKTTNRVKDEFRQELNRILKLCQDKIVQISTKPNDDIGEIVNVKDFGEIVKVSEELFKPILYYYDNQKEEACFSVVSGRTTYRYILRK